MTALDERPATTAAAVPAARPPLDDAVGQLALFDDTEWRTLPAFVEDVEWMLDTGEPPAGIARRLGITHDAVLRELAADRHDRPDLVARLTADSTGLSTGLCVPSRERGRVGGGNGDPGITAGQADAVRRLVRSRMHGRAAREVLEALGIDPFPALYGRT